MYSAIRWLKSKFITLLLRQSRINAILNLENSEIICSEQGTSCTVQVLSKKGHNSLLAFIVRNLFFAFLYIEHC